MEQIIITHRSGTQLVLQSRGGDICSVTGATQSMELNGNDTVTLNVESVQPIDFLRGDTIDVHGATYTLNELPKATKTGNRRYKYTATFEGLQYMLLDTAWLMPFSALNDTYTGTLADFAALIITNMQRLHGQTWKLGQVPSDTDTKTLSYADTNCLDVLQNICAEWEVEFAIATTGGTNTLSIHTKIGSEIDRVFEYGKGGGLYELQRNGTSDADFGTRIYFYGGSDNIPTSYFNAHQSARLCLPHKITSPTIPSTSETVLRNDSYIEFAAQVGLYGRVERTKVFEDIYPKRTGIVTAIDSENRLKFSDATTGSNAMFDLNAKDSSGNTRYLIAGTTAQIHFQTGSLSGYDFDIAAYDHSTRTFTINAIQDENNYVFPSEDNNAFRIAVGDEYIITNINMPQSYITAAQNELQTAALDWYNLHCAPALEYTANMAEVFVKSKAEEQGITDGTPIFHLGDTIRITDTAFGLTAKEFRIVNIQRNLLKQYAYTLQIAEVNPYRAKYAVRRRNIILPDIFERIGLADVAYGANQANQIAMSRQSAEASANNANRIALIIDDNNFIRPARILQGFIVSDMISNGAVVRDKIGQHAINADKIENDAIQSDHIAMGVRLRDKSGAEAINLEEMQIGEQLRVSERPYTIGEEFESSRAVRRFIAGDENAAMQLFNDKGEDVSIVSYLGATKDSPNSLRMAVAQKANASDVPTNATFNAQKDRIDALDLEAQQFVAKINSNLSSLNKAQKYLEQVRTAVNQIRTAIADSTSWTDLKKVVYRDKGGTIQGIRSIGDDGTELCRVDENGLGSCTLATLDLGVTSQLADEAAKTEP